jgi:hypothetical protein
MPTIKIVNTNQFDLQSRALDLTMSDGFLKDAHAAAAWDEETGEYLAIAVFQNRTSRGAEVHFGAARNRVLQRRDVMRGFSAYAFLLMKLPRLVAPIAAWNVEAQIAALKSGFYFIGHLSHGALDGSDAILFAMTPASCRWLPPPAKAAPSTEPPGDEDETED